MPAFFYCMINVSFGNNEKTVTLKDRIDIEPVFLIMYLGFTGQNDFEKTLQVVDQSSANCKANEIVFELVDEGSEDLSAGKVYLIGGNYNYQIYQSDAPGVDITGKKLLEQGLLRYDTETFTEDSLDAEETEKTLTE